MTSRLPVLGLALLLLACGPAPQPSVDPSPGGAPSVELSLPQEAAAANRWVDAVGGSGWDGDARHGTPAGLLDQLAEHLTAGIAGEGRAPRVAAEVLEADAATAAVRITVGDFADDSVFGSDFFARLGRDDAGWYLAELWRRDLCRRGVSNQLCT